MTIVVVAEKPSVGRDLAAVLGATVRGEGTLSGNGYVVTWAIGHLVGLCEPEGIRPEWRRWRRADLPMLPRRWPLAILESTRAQFAVVRRALNAPDVEEVICATDAGREGELIFRLIYEAAGCQRPVRRLWISSLTEGAIRAGFARLKPARDYDPLAHAAIGRSRADWLVGMNLSRAYGIALDEPLSVGRVQTPTLAMLVERELAIRDFVPEDYLEVVARFSPREGASYPGTWFRPGEGPHPTRLPVSGEEAKAVVARALTGSAAVASATSQSKRMPAPLLYDLTDLQRHCNRLYGFSAQHTLEVAQALYEKHKLLSYPRTDSRHLSSEIAGTLGAVVAAIRAPFEAQLAPGTGVVPLTRRFVDDARVGEHHAIIPTAVSADGRSLGSDEQRVYGLVCRRLLQAWHADFTWAASVVVTEVQAGQSVDRYRSHGTAIEQLGWKVLDVGEARPPRDGEGDEALLPPGLARGQPQRVVEAKAVPKRTRPPPRLNDATLLTAMETAGKTLDEKELSDAMKDSGLGTPATRASIIETLLSRGYLAREGKSLRATEKGVGLIAVVDPEVKSAAMTGQWEAQLQQISRGAAGLDGFIERVEKYVEAVVGRVPPVLPPLGTGGPPPGPGPERSSIEAARPGEHAGGASSSPGATRGSGSSPQPLSERNGSHAPPAQAAPRNDLHLPGGSREPTTARAVPQHAVGSHEPTTAPNGAGRSHERANNRNAPHEAGRSREPTNARTAPQQAGRSDELDRGRPAGPLHALLRQRFGFSSFRPHQQAVCEAVATGSDVLLVMPTGAGKSLCYQLPGLARGGTTLVVSPLIALMEDQVARLQALGLRAERIHSGRARLESRGVCAEDLEGRLDYLFIAPERLGVAGFPELLARRQLGLLAIDEAHCISQWGHDFRPDYRLLKERLPLLRPTPIIALTATATPEVQQDIVQQLGMGATARRFIHGFRRDNLAIEAIAVAPGARPGLTRQWLSAPGRLPAIVYAPTRKLAESVAAELGGRAYHAGLGTEERDAVQSAFLRGQLDVVVATVAFGMGVDKADVRTVVHLALPGSVESYYQEIGRAGRDGKPSRAVLMHHFADRKTHEFFLARDYPDEKVLQKLWRALDGSEQTAEQLRRRTRVKLDEFEKALEKLWIHGGVKGVSEDRLTRGHGDWAAGYAAQRARREQQLALVARYAEGHGCRMVALIRHFGDREDDLAPCGCCDVCAPKDCVGATFEAPTSDERTLLEQLRLRILERPGQASGRLCRELLGEDSTARPRFERLLGGLVRAGSVRVEQDEFEKDGRRIAYQRLFPAVALGGRTPEVKLSAPLQAPAGRGSGGAGARTRQPKRARRAGVALPSGGANTLLIERLRSWRLEEARRRRVPAFRILTNRALLALAQARPTTAQALRDVNGIGAKVAQTYSSQLLGLCGP